ncbi:hypothetical protein, partial [Celeribacter halophilus]|uniref:hypothetical protein n=1 Tax=Celeribacter halophilus TaxID=576117 RepID=UPI002FD6D7A9
FEAPFSAPATWCFSTESAQTGLWSFLSSLHCSFPEADIAPLAQHFDVRDGGIADKASFRRMCANVRSGELINKRWLWERLG